MSESDFRASVIIDHSASHSSTFWPAIRGLFEQGIFMDCHLDVGGQKIACHRLVLAACSPVLQAMLSSGMTEAQTNIIPIKMFGTEVTEAIVK